MAAAARFGKSRDSICLSWRSVYAMSPRWRIRPRRNMPIDRGMRPFLVPPDTGQQLDQEVDPRSIHPFAHVAGSGVMRRPGPYRALEPEVPPPAIAGHGTAGLAALSALLGEDPFFDGDRPGIVDASIYGMLANTLRLPVRTPLQAAALAHPNLVEFCSRIERMAWTGPPEPAPVSREPAAAVV